MKDWSDCFLPFHLSIDGVSLCALPHPSSKFQQTETMYSIVGLTKKTILNRFSSFKRLAPRMSTFIRTRCNAQHDHI